MKLILIIMSITKKKKKVDKNEHEYILLRTNVYFAEYHLAVEIEEKKHAGGDLIFEEKRQEALEKRLGYKFIRINTSKHYDEDYGIGRIQTFISEFKDK